MQAFLPHITFGDTACSYSFLFLFPTYHLGNKHYRFSTDYCKLRALARPFHKTTTKNRFRIMFEKSTFRGARGQAGGGRPQAAEFEGL